MLLHNEVQKFVKEYRGSLSELAFSGSPFKDVTVQELLQQIEGNRKAEKKLPAWFQTEGIVYPPKLSLEQTSSETTARYKATLVSGNTLADLTGGLGVDSFYFSEKIKEVTHFEQDTLLSEIAARNFKTFQKKNIHCITAEGLQAIEDKKFDVIYLDPSRRHDTKGRTFYLQDCEPNVPEVLDYLMDRCELLLLKTSPMLDLLAGLAALRFVYEIHIVAVANEVKEVLWLLKKQPPMAPKVCTVNIKKKALEAFDFIWGAPAEAVYGAPEAFLYEPNASILKSGCFSQLCEAFGVKKLHKHTHLYTSTSLREFPGRRFAIQKIYPYSKKEMRHGITFEQANVATRNFPERVEVLRKRWKISEGGGQYVFFTTGQENKKMMLLCKKI